jgi:hypothetical protein
MASGPTTTDPGETPRVNSGINKELTSEKGSFRFVSLLYEPTAT